MSNDSVRNIGSAILKRNQNTHYRTITKHYKKTLVLPQVNYRKIDKKFEYLNQIVKGNRT